MTWVLATLLLAVAAPFVLWPLLGSLLRARR
jgi:hypothetical protein